jgi:hypothetical protein
VRGIRLGRCTMLQTCDSSPNRAESISAKAEDLRILQIPEWQYGPSAERWDVQPDCCTSSVRRNSSSRKDRSAHTVYRSVAGLAEFNLFNIRSSIIFDCTGPIARNLQPIARLIDYRVVREWIDSCVHTHQCHTVNRGKNP